MEMEQYNHVCSEVILIVLYQIQSHPYKFPKYFPLQKKFQQHDLSFQDTDLILSTNEDPSLFSSLFFLGDLLFNA